MIYDSEVVRKNMKYMRELYGIKQTELAEVLHITQHGLSQYETGERKLRKYEFVQTLANYFRIPVEQFVKEDLSEIISFHSINDVESIFEFFEIMFPIFKSSKALEDEYFKMAYASLKNILDISKKNRVVSVEKLENCMELFIKSYNRFGTIESVANVLGFVLLIYVPAFDREKQKLGEAIYKQNAIDKDVMKHYYLGNRIDDSFVNEEFIEENSAFVLECIECLKRKSEWFELGDYYLALRYLVGVVDNGHKEDMNILIGEELMRTLVELKNKYATAYWNKKYQLFDDKE